MYTYIILNERPELIDTAAKWFHEHWGVPEEAYRESMERSLAGDPVHRWYLCLDGDTIVGGCGEIPNDFHERTDLTPNICAVYTMPEHRCLGIAGKLLDLAVEDNRARGISPVYLVTDHTSFYERYGWEFLCMAKEEDADTFARMYIHK